MVGMGAEGSNPSGGWRCVGQTSASPLAPAWKRPTVVGAVPLGRGFPLLFHNSRWRPGLVRGNVVLVVGCGHKGDGVSPYSIRGLWTNRRELERVGGGHACPLGLRPGAKSWLLLTQLS